MSNKTDCTAGRHNWGDLSPYLDTMAMGAARGLTRQTVTFICDTCNLRLVYVDAAFLEEVREAVRKTAKN